MKYHVQTIWYNLEGDGFSHAEFVEAGNEDQACIDCLAWESVTCLIVT